MILVVLASGSRIRRTLLENAGVAVDVLPAAVDEGELKASLRTAGASVGDAAEALAELKALRSSRLRPGLLTIGADQMLECDGQWFDKPGTPEAAREQLRALRGRRHELVSAVVAVRDGQRLWHARDTARLHMRDFSDAFLDRYLAAMGDTVLTTVGGYQLEGLGTQLFARVEGDFFTILGLPLLPLLEFLRQQRILED